MDGHFRPWESHWSPVERSGLRIVQAYRGKYFLLGSSGFASTSSHNGEWEHLISPSVFHCGRVRVGVRAGKEVVAMYEADKFVGRARELEELHEFAASPDNIFVLIGKPGMGKSALVHEFQRGMEKGSFVFISALFVVNRDQSSEDFASLMLDTLTRGRFLFWGPDDKRKLKSIAGVLPGIAPLIQALIKDDNRSHRQKLVDLLNTLAAKSEHPIVLIMDPYDYLEKDEYEDFFTTLARCLPATVKLIVPQRPTDVIASSSRFLALPGVRTNSSEVGTLGKEDSYKMARLLGADTTDEDQLAVLWDETNGWPFALFLGAGGIARGENLSAALLRDTEKLCAHLLDVCPNHVRQLLYACSLPALEIRVDDVRAVAGVSDEEFGLAMDDPTSRQAVLVEERFGFRYLRLFHVLFRNYVRGYMGRIGVSNKGYVGRLSRKLLDDARSLYSEMDTKTVTERDAGALEFARRLRMYQSLLVPNEATEELARILLHRAGSLRLGGRSYSLYSLLVLAQGHSLVVPDEGREEFLKIMHTILVEDSFLHPEYAMLLVGAVLSQAGTLVQEPITVCRSRLRLLAEQSASSFLRDIASRVNYALDQGVSPLTAFDLDELLPNAYSEEISKGEDWEPQELRLRAEKLIGMPVSRWNREDHELMYRYISRSRRPQDV